MLLSPKFQLRLTTDASPSLLPSVKAQASRLVQLAVKAAVGETLAGLTVTFRVVVPVPPRLSVTVSLTV